MNIPPKGTRYRCRAKHSLTVEVIGPVEVRIAETRWPCIAYAKDGKLYARTLREFEAKFERITWSEI